ncbi:helix-turn-helix domain-containing protein [Paenibacillus sp. Leaf72]|uniref:helix-turn-helix domain-containing protein n=1 Tax=Paenibacillus sp. Leaf72 TaxID=1736234 RepID=UPI001F3F943D|nr:helix-turn-helix domain-containing protein [Paenibacillus sp. Leaf72]
MIKRMKARLMPGAGKAAGPKGRFYRKNLILLLVVCSIPGLITGALVYFLAGGILEDRLLEQHNEQIKQRAQSIDEQLTNLELMLSHWAFDSKFDYTLGNRDYVQQFEKARDITKTLLVMQGSNTMNKQVGLYLGGDQHVLFGPEYGVLQGDGQAEAYEGLLQSDKVAYWTQVAFDAARPSQKELTLVHYVPGGSLHPFGALLIRLDNDKVSDMLRTMTPGEGGETYLMQDNGELYASTSGNDRNSEFVSALNEAVAAESSNKGSFLFRFSESGMTYAVSYGKLSRISDNWTYVSASPITGITEPVMVVSKSIVVVSLGALLLAAILAWLASRSIYSPVNRLMTVLRERSAPAGKPDCEFTWIEREWQHLHRESEELHAKLSEQLPHVKESFLHQLLQGYLADYSEGELLRRMERYKWQIEPGTHYMVLYMKLTGIANLEGKFKYGDEGLATFAAVNMMEELAATYFEQSNTINFHNLAAGLLIIVPEGRSYREELHAFSEAAMQAFNQILNMRATIAISPDTASITEIPHLFEETKHAVSFRRYDQENQIIDMEQLEEQGSAAAEPAYPFTLEREFIQALRTGREAEAYELLEQFLQALSSAEAKEMDVQQGMLHLLGAVQHAIMVSGIAPNRLFKGANRYEQLSQIREPELLLDWFRGMIAAPFLRELGERTNAQVKRQIEHAMLYLQQHYMSDISLDSCAEHIGMNPFFLSKSFKQVTGKNFIDYLTGLRMDKAKELLRESVLKINDVAERVGYQHSYFNRIFKKLEGMTPSRYRELSQAE